MCTAVSLPIAAGTVVLALEQGARQSPASCGAAAVLTSQPQAPATHTTSLPVGESWAVWVQAPNLKWGINQRASQWQLFKEGLNTMGRELRAALLSSPSPPQPKSSVGWTSSSPYFLQEMFPCWHLPGRTCFLALSWQLRWA